VVCRKGGLDLGHDLTAGVLNLSQTGILLKLKAELPEGQEVTLTMESYDRPRPLRVLGNVIWCVPDGDAWRAGIRLQKRLTFLDFLKLTAHL
jgi:Tfp pilus assembly protein PilZ